MDKRKKIHLKSLLATRKWSLIVFGHTGKCAKAAKSFNNSHHECKMANGLNDEAVGIKRASNYQQQQKRNRKWMYEWRYKSEIEQWKARKRNDHLQCSEAMNSVSATSRFVFRNFIPIINKELPLCGQRTGSKVLYICLIGSSD